MKQRTLAEFGTTILMGGLVAGTLLAAVPGEAQVYRRGSTHRTGDFDRDGIRNHRDRDIDNDGIVNGRDRHDYSYSRSRSTRNRSSRDWDGDGILNSRDRDIDNDG